MSGFVKRKSANTVNPAGGINPAQTPNVGQYGWTSFDANNVNQIIEYVNMCKEYAEKTKDYADYVENRFGELEQFMNFIETVYAELKPIIDQIQPIYTDIVTRHEDVITRHIDIIKLHNEVTSDKIEINQIKQDAIDETNQIKQDTIAATEAIKAATIAETLVIKNQATAEADRAKTEADRSAVEAVKSENSATSSAASATASEESNQGSKGWFDKSYELYEELRKGQVYRGTWNIEEQNAFPPKPDTNSVWDITLKESSTQFTFAGEIWYWGDRLLYLKDSDQFSQIESGSGVISVNGKTGAVTIDAHDVGAVQVKGDTMKGNLEFEAGKAQLILNSNYVKGYNDSVVLRDHGNGNVTFSASLKADGTPGTLYIGYNGTISGHAGYNTKDVRLDSPMSWRGTTSLITGEGKINSEAMTGPIRTERDDAGVWHTVVGGTDTVNRGRTIIAGGEAGKHIADNIPTASEQVHIGGDDTNGVLFHTGLQNGWDGSTHYRYWFNQGNLYSQKRPDGATYKFYHDGNKPTPTAIGAITKAGDTSIGDLTLSRGKVLDATLTHRSGYMSIHPYNSNYGGDVTGNRCRIYYKEHENGNPSSINRGLLINSTDGDGISHDMNIWLNGKKVFHEGYRPTASQLNVLSLDGGTMKGHIVLTDAQTTIKNASGTELLRASNESAVVGNYGGRTYINSKDNPVVRTGGSSTEYKIYHEGNKPSFGDIIGTGNSTKKTVTIAKPSGVVDGKYYPVAFINTENFSDVFISSTSSSAAHSMNNCSFTGKVLSGGNSDKGGFVTGDFKIYDTNERAIHSVVGATESRSHYVFYVEARAFPLTVVVDSEVDVTCSGKDVVYGTSTYTAGISDMTSSGDYGVKIKLLQDFNRGSGFYSGTARLSGLDVKGNINSSNRILVDGVNDEGSFLTRRPGKTLYAMFGQDANESTSIGTGTSLSKYTSFVKVSPTKLVYSKDGTSESRIYHEGFKPSLGELGGIASSGGTMTGALNWDDTTKYVKSNGSHILIGATAGTVYLQSKTNPVATVDGNQYAIYHEGKKPTAADTGALANSGTQTLAGRLRIEAASSHIDLIETNNADKGWRVEAQGGNLSFVEVGVAGRATFKAGGGTVLSGQLDVAGHVVLREGNILKFPSPNYSAGAQIYTRDGGQYGSNFVINTGGNMILGAGESGTALANVLGAATTEHAYVVADGDVNVVVNANNIENRLTHRFGSNGAVYLNDGGNQKATVYLGSTDNYIFGTGANTHISGKGGKVIVESKDNPIVRMGSNDYIMYHSGNKPTIDELALGKAIGASQALGVVDLNDFQTPGVFHQSTNTNATNGQNYPVPLAGSLVVYATAGVIQEYRVYNSSRLFRRAKYSTAAWTPWAEDYNTINIPNATTVGALPIYGGRIQGTLEVAPAVGQNCINLLQNPNTGSNAVGITGYTANGSQAVWGAGMYYSGGNPQYAYFGSGASPWVNGIKVSQGEVTTNGNFIAGGYSLSNSGFRVNKSEYPLMELHRVGTYAFLSTIDGVGNYILGNSNGAGTLIRTCMKMHSTAVEFSGKVSTLYGTTRSWLSQGTASFAAPEIPVSAGNLVASTSQKVYYSGVAALEYGRGYYIDGSAVGNWAHALFANDGSSYNRFWLFRNNGGQQSPSNFKISPDGHMSGNAYEGYEDHFQWSITNLGATTDARMVKVLGRSTAKALDVVDKLQVSKLVWKEEAGAVHTTRDVKVTEFGLVADEVEEVDATFVKTIRVGGENPTETKTLDTAAMLALAMKAIQEQQVQINELKEKLNGMV